MKIETRLKILQRHVEQANISYETKEAFEQIIEILKEIAGDLEELG